MKSFRCFSVDLVDNEQDEIVEPLKTVELTTTGTNLHDQPAPVGIWTSRNMASSLVVATALL